MTLSVHLKADKRWQYTENAKEEVADAALKSPS
jgi:hypothetical protein